MAPSPRPRRTAAPPAPKSLEKVLIGGLIRELASCCLVVMGMITSRHERGRAQPLVKAMIKTVRQNFTVKSVTIHDLTAVEAMATAWTNIVQTEETLATTMASYEPDHPTYQEFVIGRFTSFLAALHTAANALK